MATHDYNIANQGFPAFRADLNDALAAIVSNNSNATAPATTFAHMVWVDTAADPSILKIRNADNDAWITIGSINQTDDKFKLTPADGISTDTISELTSAAGVTVDGVLLKDSGVGSAASPVSLNSLNYPTEGSVNFRNRIINGDMRIDQRNAGASVTPTNAQYTLDRYQSILSAASKYSIQQVSDAPTGFVNSLRVTSSSAYAVPADEVFQIRQSIEGTNCSDLAFGSASAKTVTLSFWVRSSLTGTFGGRIQNSAANRNYPFSYTISIADTWEYKTVTIAGDTTGTWLTTTGIGIQIRWSLGSGSNLQGTAGSWTASNISSVTGETQVVATNGATWYITGVQLEVGSVATPFERRPYGTELQLCQRYFISYGGNNFYETFALGYNSSTTNAIGKTFFPVEMRATPSIATSGALGVYDGAGTVSVTSVAADQPSSKVFNANYTVASGLTAYRPIAILANNSTASRVQFSAEL